MSASGMVEIVGGNVPAVVADVLNKAPSADVGQKALAVRVISQVSSGGGTSVQVTNFPASQAVTAAVLPLPTGAAQDGTDGAAPPSIPGTGIRGWLRSIYDRLASVAVTGTFWQATQPVSGTFWQATQPVSGTVTANAGTNLNTSSLALDATLTGGSQKSIARGGAKGSTAAADITSNPVDANTQALHVDGSKVIQPISAASLPLPSGAATDASLTNGNLRVGGTTAVSAASLPLPSGAATDASITNGNLRGTVTANAGTNLNTSALALEAGGNLALVKAKTDNLDVLLSSRTKPADQQHAIVDSSALPSGASTDASLTNGTQVARATVGGNVGQQLMAASLPVAIALDQAEAPTVAASRRTLELDLIAQMEMRNRTFSVRASDRINPMERGVR